MDIFKKVILVFVVLQTSVFSEQKKLSVGTSDKDRLEYAALKQNEYYRQKVLIFQMLYLDKCTPEEIKNNGYADQLVRDMIKMWKFQDRGIYRKRKIYDSIIKTAFTGRCLKSYKLPSEPSKDILELVGLNIDNNSDVKLYEDFVAYVNEMKNNKDLLVLEFLK